MDRKTIYCLDSTFIIDYLKGVGSTKKLLSSLKNKVLYTTEISIFEVSKGIFGQKNKKEFDAFLIFLENIEIIPTTTLFALDAGAISGSLRKKGITIDDADLMIASMMKNFGINKIITKNKKHFSKIKGIKVLSYS